MKSERIRAGDHLWIQCFGYTHHGIASGPNSVIHYRGKSGVYEDGRIAETSLYDFSDGATIYTEEHPDRRHNRRESVERARERIGETEYNLVFNNCEHFVSWCIDGEHSSAQVNDAARKGADGATAWILYGSYQKWAAAQRVSTVCGPVSKLASTAAALSTASAASSTTTATLTGLASGASASSVVGLLGTGTAATAVGFAAAPAVLTITAGMAIGGLVYTGWKALFDD